MAKRLKYFLMAIPIAGFAQRIDNAPRFEDLPAGSVIRFTYQNDYFAKSDYYYSQGFNFEFATPRFKDNPLNRLLPALAGQRIYGIAVEHNIFTPRVITTNAILYGDRPFAATLMVQFNVSSFDTIGHRGLSSVLSIGAIGPAALRKEIQTNLHQFLNTALPEGWKNQVGNDLLVSYQMSYRRRLFQIGGVGSVYSVAKIRLGTVNTNLSGGFSGIFGNVNEPIRRARGEKFSIVGYLSFNATVVGYDATLQGGLFNRDSPYTIAAKDIERLTLQGDFGIVLRLKRVGLEVSQSGLTKEFRSGRPHRYGGVALSYQL